MRKLRIASALALVGITILALPVVADFSDAEYEGSIVVLNAGDAVSHVVTYLEMNTDAFQEAGFLETDYSNVEFCSGSGSPMAFMPIPETDGWAFYYPWSLSESSQTNCVVYMGGPDMSAPLRYLPGTAGASTPDAAGLEPGNNFDIELTGYIDTSEGPLVAKLSALTVFCSSGELVINVPVPSDRTANVTPGVASSWQDVDVSAYVPTDAVGVLLDIVSTNNAYKTCVRPNGSTNDLSTLTHGASQRAFVAIDDNDIFECYVSSLAGTDVYLLGYVTDEWVFRENWVDVTGSTTGSYVDVDVSASVPAGACAALLEITNSMVATGLLEINIRQNGSSDDLKHDLLYGGHSYVVVALDDDRIFESYRESSYNHVYLVGYITSGFVPLSDAVEKPYGSAGAWLDVDTTDHVPGGAVAQLFQFSSTTALDRDFRSPLDATEHYQDGNYQEWVIVPNACEAKCQTTNGILNLLGYFTDGVIFFDPPVSVSGMVATGHHTVKVSADGTDLTLTVDSSLVDTCSLGGVSVTDTATAWTYCTGGSCPYVESLDMWVSGTLVQSIDFCAVPGGVYEDSVGTYDITPTFPTASSDPDVTASLVSLEPFGAAEAPGYTLDEEGNLIGGAPAEPDNLYDEMDVDHIPGADLINTLLDAGNIPRTLFWFPLAFGLISAVSILVYKLSRSLFAMSITATTLLIFASRTGIVPFWVAIPFILLSVGILVKERTVSF